VLFLVMIKGGVTPGTEKGACMVAEAENRYTGNPFSAPSQPWLGGCTAACIRGVAVVETSESPKA